MKPFIYLSTLLITAGSVFGLADYFKEKKSGTMARLYHEEEEPAAPEKKVNTTVLNAIPAVAKEEMKMPVGTTEVKKTIAVEKKVKKKVPRKPISIKMFTRGDERPFRNPKEVQPTIIKLPEPIKVTPVEPVKEVVPEVKEVKEIITPVAMPVAEKAPERPSLRKLYSRGKMPRREKKETVKSEE
jgi:hypothetical protein